MKKLLCIFFLIVLHATASAQSATTTTPSGVRWYFSPSFSAMFLAEHVGVAPGVEVGVRILKQRLQVGFIVYNRSGPINPHTERLVLEEGQTYKGQSQLDLRSDHGAFGIVIAPQFRFGKLTVDVPLVAGQVGAGFYLTGDNRITPDGRRTSEWENELMDERDAGTGFFVEGGVRAKLPLNGAETILGGVGIYYTQTLGYESLVGGSDYYNAPRAALFLQFGN